MADDNTDKPDATTETADPLKDWVSQGYLKPDYKPEDVARLFTSLQKSGRISYQQALQPKPPGPSAVPLEGFHPPADTSLDKAALEAANIGVPSTGTAEDVAKSEAPMKRELSRFGGNEAPPAEGTGETPQAAVQERDLGQMPREQPEPSGPPVTSGGGGPSAGAALGQIGADYGGEAAALEEEKQARQKYAEDVGGKLRQEAGEEIGGATDREAEAKFAYSKAQDSIREIHQLVNDYANGHIDKDQWWTEKSMPQKIGAVIGAIAAGLTGNPNVVMNYVNGMINSNLARQQEEINRKGKAGMMAVNLLNSFLGSSNNYQEAMDKSRLAMVHAAIVEAQRAAVVAQGPIEAARIDQSIAALQTQYDMLAMKVMAGGSGGAAGGMDNALMIDPKSFYQDPFSGQAYKLANPADMGSFMNVMQGYGRVLDVINKGEVLLANRDKMEKTPGGMYEANKPYADTLVQGEALSASAKGAAAKLEGARGVPSGITEIVNQMLPNFGSRFATLDKKKLDMARQMVQEFMQQALSAHGAVPIQAQMGPGRGKHAGEMVPYAILGARQMQEDKMKEKAEKQQQAAQGSGIDFQPSGK